MNAIPYFSLASFHLPFYILDLSSSLPFLTPFHHLILPYLHFLRLYMSHISLSSCLQNLAPLLHNVSLFELLFLTSFPLVLHPLPALQFLVFHQSITAK